MRFLKEIRKNGKEENKTLEKMMKNMKKVEKENRERQTNGVIGDKKKNCSKQKNQFKSINIGRTDKKYKKVTLQLYD